ncbi:MAG TPA: tyrosine-type recombinase/integrase [Clostridia bacterium]|nr:tyrosine-type recombinase/integrase [Clostridia bacterium]
MTAFAPVLEGYFTERLAQRRASPHTVASYRDTFCLLLRYAQVRLAKEPAVLDLADLDVAVIGGFLDHLEHDRANSVATRNTRLAAIHSLFRYAALRCPEHAGMIQRVLAVPQKRFDSTIVTFLERDEIDALLTSPDRTTWLGRRDHVLLLVAVQTGLRVSELTGLTGADVELGTGANVHCIGKGRKERRTPLTAPTAVLVAKWISECGIAPRDPLFPSRTGGQLSRDAVADLLTKHVTAATGRCPSLASKRVSPHVLRHSCAMALVHAQVDILTIGLWLGHSGTKATYVYIHADMALKEQALARTAPSAVSPTRYKAPDSLIAFLEAL